MTFLRSAALGDGDFAAPLLEELRADCFFSSLAGCSGSSTFYGDGPPRVLDPPYELVLDFLESDSLTGVLDLDDVFFLVSSFAFLPAMIYYYLMRNI